MDTERLAAGAQKMNPGRITAGAMAQWWRTAPAQAGECADARFSAAIWDCSWARDTEIFAEPDGETHIVSIHLDGVARTSHYHDDKRVYAGTITPASVNIVPAGRRPRAIIQSECLRFLHLYVNRAHLHRLSGELGVGSDQIELVPLAYERDTRLASIASMLRQELMQFGPTRLFLEAAANLAGAQLIRQHSSGARGQAPLPGRRSAGLAPWQLKRVLAKLSDEIDRDVGLHELAKLVGLSETYLCTAFRNATGLPPHQWQKQMRVERAKTLLETTQASITEIALDVGYSNPGHFATMFRVATGLTPRAWRRERVR